MDNLLAWARDYPHLWEILVGAYFSDWGMNPGEALSLLGTWDWDWIQEDRNPGRSLAKFQIPPGAEGDMVRNIAGYILDGKEHLFAFAINWWQSDQMYDEHGPLEQIIFRAGWACDLRNRYEWQVVGHLKRMHLGPEKSQAIEQAHQEFPKFVQWCLFNQGCRYVILIVPFCPFLCPSPKLMLE